MLTALLVPLQGSGQTKTTKSKEIDYSSRSNIIKHPEKLRGDEKAIFYHPFFLDLNYEEAKSLKPLEIKSEFAKLGIFIKDKNRFSNAWDFYDLKIVYHKKSCENWEYFDKLLNPKRN